MLGWRVVHVGSKRFGVCRRGRACRGSIGADVGGNALTVHRHLPRMGRIIGSAASCTSPSARRLALRQAGWPMALSCGGRGTCVSGLALAGSPSLAGGFERPCRSACACQEIGRRSRFGMRRTEALRRKSPLAAASAAGAAAAHPAVLSARHARRRLSLADDSLRWQPAGCARSRWWCGDRAAATPTAPPRWRPTASRPGDHTWWR